MFRQMIALSVVLLAIVLLVAPAKGQQSRTSSDSPTLVDRMENFGRTLLGVRPTNSQQRSTSATTNNRPVPADTSSYERNPYANSTSARSARHSTTQRAVVASGENDETAAVPNPVAGQRVAGPTVASRDNAVTGTSASAADSRTTETSESPPLYQRMSSFRQSVFPEPTKDQRKPEGASAAKTLSPSQPDTAGRSRDPEVATDAKAGSQTSESEVSSKSFSQSHHSHVGRPQDTEGSRTGAKSGSSLASGSSSSVLSRGEPLIASRPSTTVSPLPDELMTPARATPTPRTVNALRQSENRGTSESSSAPSARPISAPIVPATSTTPKPTLGVKKTETGGRGVLLSRQSPNLSAETIGPQKIMVGKESAYEVTINNSGEAAVEELLVFVGLPAWAEVLGAEVSVGATQVVPLGQGARQFQWKVGRLDSRSRERLTLRIKPLESRPFDLAIKWDYKQVATQTMIEVQEPKLALHMDGPRDVLYGKREIYRLKVANTGNGDAENVVIRLQPLGGSEQTSATHNFGTVAAGEDRAIEVELTARQAGTLTMKVEAQCDGGMRAELKESVVVRRAALQLETAAPKFQYVDAQAHYRIRVSNPGTAPARDVEVTAVLPAGAKLLSVSDEGKLDPDRKQLLWKLDQINPATERWLQANCTLSEAGSCRIEVKATAGDLTASAIATTQVEAIADLVMDLVDPVGPIAVGEDAAYELRVHNRGTRAAGSIDVAVYFSQGIEPVSVEGGSHRISLGQVAFQTIPTLGPGKEMRLKVVARAQTPGNHICRSELHCRPLGTRLVSEETTHFFLAEGDPAGNPGSAAAQTADRRGPIPVPNTSGVPSDLRPSKALPGSDRNDQSSAALPETRR